MEGPGADDVLKAEKTPATGKVSFFHERSPEKWSRILAQLRPATEEGWVHDASAFVNLVSEVRDDGGSMSTLSFAADELPEGLAGEDAATLQQMGTWLARLVSELPLLFPEGVPQLLRGSPGMVKLSRRQCAALLAAGLFGALPDTEVQSQNSCGPLELPDFSFDTACAALRPLASCLLCYFARLAAKPEPFLEECVSFARRCLKEEAAATHTGEFFSTLDVPLTPIRVVEGAIEDAAGMLHADFANEYLGGGVLSGGNVQEEIRFSVCPECLVGMLFCEAMQVNESITIVGALQYSKYTGYGGSFRFDGPTDLPASADYNCVDRLNRRGPVIVAFDALYFPGSSQYEKALIHRELLKVYCTCLGDPEEESSGRGDSRAAFATGNWGCGVFGGDPQLKSLIQWLAASAANRHVAYYPFADRRVDRLAEVAEAIQASGAKASDLYHLLQSHSKSRPVFDVVLERLRSAAAS